LSTHRTATRAAGLLVGAGLLLAACSSSGGIGPASSLTAAGNMDTLVANAKAEGNLTTIALPHDWCNYGEMLSTFTAKYGIKVNELNPAGSSGQEIDAIKANKGNTGPQAPDVIDVGLGFAPQITGQTPTAAASAQTPGPAEELVTPYKVSTWDSIPASAKDPNGMWYGDYYGVMAFETDTSRVKNVPKDWNDLLDPQYKGQVALSGNPTKSNQAISGVWASGFPAGGSLDSASQGLDFFKKLNDAGNFVPVIAGKATVASGETPIRITWSYNGLADKDSLAGNPAVTVAVPTTGRFGGMYIQGISKYAPHPNAARLWEEYLYSDAGQNIWLKGYCNPIRYEAMVTAGTVDAAAQAKLPDTKGVVLPTQEQINTATEVITKGWPTVVGVTVPDK
jgi:putative spermidine/putrescine transport system substrate-binding protein